MKLKLILSLCLSVCLVVLQLFFCSEIKRSRLRAFSPTSLHPKNSPLAFLSKINNPNRQKSSGGISAAGTREYQSVSILFFPQTFIAPPATFSAVCFERGCASLPTCPAGLLGWQASGMTGLVPLEAGLTSSDFFTLAIATISEVLRLRLLLLPGRVGE
jgi:hypothetical protein